MKKEYQKPAMQAHSMTMTCMVCESKVTTVYSGGTVGYGGGSSQNSGGVRTKDRGWGDAWGEDDWEN